MYVLLGTKSLLPSYSFCTAADARQRGLTSVLLRGKKVSTKKEKRELGKQRTENAVGRAPIIHCRSGLFPLSEDRHQASEPGETRASDWEATSREKKNREERQGGRESN